MPILNVIFLLFQSKLSGEIVSYLGYRIDFYQIMSKKSEALTIA